jgi:hypothetical protein
VGDEEGYGGEKGGKGGGEGRTSCRKEGGCEEIGSGQGSEEGSGKEVAENSGEHSWCEMSGHMCIQGRENENHRERPQAK